MHEYFSEKLLSSLFGEISLSLPSHFSEKLRPHPSALEKLSPLALNLIYVATLQGKGWHKGWRYKKGFSIRKVK